MQRKISFKLVFIFAISTFIFCCQGDILSDRQQIESLIDAGKLAQAQGQIEKLKSDYANSSNMPETLYWLAEKYRWTRRYDQARQLHQQIITENAGKSIAEKSQLAVSRIDALSLIQAGSYSQARQAVDALAVNFQGHIDLPETLYWLGREFEWNGQFEQQKHIYENLIQNYPAHNFAHKAELGYARANIQPLIKSGRYDEAKTAIDELETDFAAHPDLFDTLYWLAGQYHWVERWDDAKYYYQQIIERCTDQPQVERARLGLANVEVIELIVNRNFSPAEKALDELIANNNSNPDLPQTLYRIARAYEWQSEYEKGKEIHELIAARYTGNEFSERAKIGIERDKASILITSGKMEDANSVVAAIKADFKNNPDYTETLYEIAKVYDYVDSVQQVTEMHSSIIADFPDDKFASDASLKEAKLKTIGLIDSAMYDDANLVVAEIRAKFAGSDKYFGALEGIAEQYDKAEQIARAAFIYREIVNNCRVDNKEWALAQAELDKYGLFAAVDSGDKTLIEKTVNELGGPLANQPDGLADYLNTLAIKCYSEARWSLIENNDNNRAAIYYQTSIRLDERAFNECPNSPLAPVTCFCAAVIAQQELGDYSKGIEYFQKTSDDWPGFEHSAWALVKVAETLELAARSGELDAEGARLAGIAVLKSVIDKYPQDEMAEYAQERLDYYNKIESEQDPNQPVTSSSEEGEL